MFGRVSPEMSVIEWHIFILASYRPVLLQEVIKGQNGIYRIPYEPEMIRVAIVTLYDKLKLGWVALGTEPGLTTDRRLPGSQWADT